MKHILITGGAGFIGSNLALEIQNRFPEARVTVIDDFRSGNFKNLLGFKGEVLAFDVAQKEWLEIFKDRPLDTIFHLASITDTTVLDERKMIFDNVEGFRNVLELASRKKAEVIYASSAAVYGSQNTPMKEEDAGKPNNIYGFSKWAMDQLTASYESKSSLSPPKIVGLRYFNVFGPGEFHKGAAASMIPDSPPITNIDRKPTANSMGVWKRSLPPYIVASQLNILMPVGIETSRLATAK